MEPLQKWWAGGMEQVGKSPSDRAVQEDLRGCLHIRNLVENLKAYGNP